MMPTVDFYIRVENYDKLRKKAELLGKSEAVIVNMLRAVHRYLDIQDSK
jgi:hypothetical protein